MILTDDMLPDMRTIRQTAERFRLPVHFVRQAVKNGDVVAVQAGRKCFYVNQASMIAYLNGGTNGKEQ